MLLTVTVPSGHELGPQCAEQLLSALHGACSGKQQVGLGLDCRNGMVGLVAEVPDELGSLFAERLADAYPDARVEPNESVETPADWEKWQQKLRPSAELFSLRTFHEFEHSLTRTLADPLTGILSALRVPIRRPVRLRATLLLHPASHRRCRRAVRFAERITALLERHHTLAMWSARLAGDRRWALRVAGNVVCRALQRSAATSRTVESLRSRLEGPLFEARLVLEVAAPAAMRREALVRLRLLVAAFSPLSAPHSHLYAGHVTRVRRHYAFPRRGFLLSVPEAATIWHPPTETVRVATMSRTPYRQLEPPLRLPTPSYDQNVAVLGRVDFRDRREQFGLLPEDRRRHLAIIGKTGMGKSTLLSSLLISDMRAGRGVGLIDPHGDLAEFLLAAVPRHRANDVVLLDAGDRDFPVAFNPLACPRPDQRALVASGVVAALKHQYADSWGPRLEHILRCAVLTLIETPGSSLASLLRLLSDTHYRRNIVARLKDPVVKNFWQREFDTWRPQFQVEAVAPIQNKVGQFLSHPVLRGILGQSHSTLDLRRVLDDGQIFIANLSKGKIGEDGSALLRSLLVSGLQAAAMSRSDIPESQRRDFHLVVDEFQNCATESFATILSEARKYRLCLTLANQYLDQVPESVRAAVFGNVGSLLAFQVGGADAEALATELGSAVTPQDLVGLPKYTAYARLLVNGQSVPPFSMTTVAPTPGSGEHRMDLVRRTSRHRYARRAAHVEAEIAAAFVR